MIWAVAAVECGGVRGGALCVVCLSCVANTTGGKQHLVAPRITFAGGGDNDRRGRQLVMTVRRK
jgi:hypothetical protein